MSKAPGKGSLAVLFLTVFIDLLGFGIVLPLLPIYGKYFAGGEAAQKWIVGLLMASFSVMQFLFAPVWGRVSDRVGRRPILLLGLLGSVVFYTLFGLATRWQNLAWLFVARIGAGICGATISTAQAYIADTTSQQNRAKGMALIGAAFGLGFTFGPLFGAAAFRTGSETPTELPGYLAAGLSAVAWLLGLYKLPESLRPDSQPARGSVLDLAALRHAWFDLAALRQAVATPSVGLLLIASFICVFSFGNFETTLSMLLKGPTGEAQANSERQVASGGRQPPDAREITAANQGADAARSPGPFRFEFREICYTYAFIGLMLMVVQGGIVRRLAGRVSEAAMAAAGAIVQVAGFGLMIEAIREGSVGVLFVALALVVAGFAMMTPSVNSLISRRSDPAWQGGILGLTQSANALARIVAPLVGVPLLHVGAALPFILAAALMALGGLLILSAARRGTDYALPTTAEG